MAESDIKKEDEDRPGLLVASLDVSGLMEENHGLLKHTGGQRSDGTPPGRRSCCQGSCERIWSYG